MAFTGAATVVQVADDVVRITGLSLAGAAAGTIGLSTSTGSPGVALPAAFQPAPYVGPNGQAVALQDAVEIDVRNAATGIATPVPIAVVKTGTTPLDFLITITNLTGSTLSPALEIYVKFHT